MPKKRPVNLNLTTMRFPATAIASILHRISGLIVFLLLPCVLWGFSASLEPQGFAYWQRVQACWGTRLLEWILLSSFLYHVIAGLRHLAMDAGYFEKKQSGRISAGVVIIISAMLILAAGVWLL